MAQNEHLLFSDNMLFWFIVECNGRYHNSISHQHLKSNCNGLELLRY